MAKQVEAPISPEQLKDASSNFLSCLRLPTSSQVLIIADKLPETGEIDPHLDIRRELSIILKRQIGDDHPVAMIEFGKEPKLEELPQWFY